MLKIEDIRSNERYSISLCFDRNYTKEKLVFGDEEQKIKYFSNNNSAEYKIMNKKRTLGSLLIEAIQFSESSDYGEICTIAENVLKSIKAVPDNKAVINLCQTALFSLYNGTENIFEKCIIAKLWQGILRTGIRTDLKNNVTSFYDFSRTCDRFLNREKAFSDFHQYLKLLFSFIRKGSLAEDRFKNYYGKVAVYNMPTDSGINSILTDADDMIAFFSVYRGEIARQGRHMNRCVICGKPFITSRSNEHVCSNECHSKRQTTYMKNYKSNIENDEVSSEYEKLRSRHDNFIKKLRKQNAPETAIEEYIEFKHNFLEAGKKKKKDVKRGRISEDDALKWIDKKNIERIHKEDAMLRKLNIV